MSRESVLSSGEVATRTAALETGSVVRVESDAGDIWSARITNISDKLIGLRGSMTVNRQFRARDRVTLNLERGDALMCVRAQVLSADGTLMRVVRRDDSVEQERRRAPRLRVEVTASLALEVEPGSPARWFDAEVIDLSNSGCAVGSSGSLRVGTRLRIDLPLGTARIDVSGVVVRTWTSDVAPSTRSGIQFDPLPASTVGLLNRFLLDQIRAG